MTEQNWTVTVSELNEYVQRSLRSDPILRDLRLRGQISGIKFYPTGVWYFDLKDEGASISCVMFRQAVSRMSFVPENGDQVVLHGSAGLYAQRGQFQFVADSMRPEGVGSLWRQFEALKNKLQAEGLFDTARKRPLPVRPGRIAVVTSEAGAVLHDICRVSRNRDPGVSLVLVPVPVQGPDAGPEIAEGIRLAGRLPAVDVIITGRGGGSMEDLWCFNEECVARAIAESPVPVISAVGHETDFTIADFTADRRASTPSNAAEIAVPDRAEELKGLGVKRERLKQLALSELTDRKLRLQDVRAALTEASPERLLREKTEQRALLRIRLDRAADDGLSVWPARLAMAGVRIDNTLQRQMEQRSAALESARRHLEALSPARVLERGWALVTEGSRVIARASEAAAHMQVHFADGTVNVRREED